MDSLPREIISHIIVQEIDHGWEMDYPRLWLGIQLYSCCRAFSWLAEIYFTLPVFGEYRNGYESVNLFGRMHGPSYWIQHSPSPPWNIGTEFVYIVDGKKVGEHCFIYMVTSNFGLNIVNNIAFDYEDDTMYACTSQIYSQMTTVDPVMREMIDILNATGETSVLVRVRVPENNYKIVVPEMEIDKDRQHYAEESFSL